MEYRATRSLAALASRTFRRHLCSGLQTQRPRETLGNGSGRWDGLYLPCIGTGHSLSGQVPMRTSMNCEDIKSIEAGIDGANPHHQISSACAYGVTLGGHNVPWVAARASKQTVSQGVFSDKGPAASADFFMLYMNWRRYDCFSHLQQSDYSLGIESGSANGTALESSLIGHKLAGEVSSPFSVLPVTLDDDCRNVIPFEVSSVKRKRKKKMNKHKHRKLRKRDRHRN